MIPNYDVSEQEYSSGRNLLGEFLDLQFFKYEAPLEPLITNSEQKYIRTPTSKSFLIALGSLA
jgi:hypothetical protein